jgi:pycsar effector protein
MYTFDILEKQYRNYTWNDGKAYALATLDSFLFAAGFVIYDKLSHNVIAASMLFGAILFLSVSALSCCVHCVPTLRSGRSGPNDNLRALSCITAFGTWQAYHAALEELKPDRMFEMTCRQIYGMAHNNTRSHRLLAIAARCTMVGLCLLLLAITTGQYGKELISIGGRDRPAAGPTNKVKPANPTKTNTPTKITGGPS